MFFNLIFVAFVATADSLKLPRSLQSVRTKSGLSPLFSSVGNKRNYAISIPQKPPKSVDKRAETAGRRNLGPQKRSRKQLIPTDETLTGRVSVYCVGGALDLQALRSHVFRRGFGSQIVGDDIDPRTAELVLARGKPGEMAIADDDVLHISNAPLFIAAAAADKRGVGRRGGGDSSEDRQAEGWETEVVDGFSPTSSSIVSGSGVDRDDDTVSDEEWKQREMLLMTTQDIFYFDYGCVVFWGLSVAEEQAAMAELATFTVDPVNSSELDASYDTLEYTFDRKANPQRPIRFDRMKLRSLQTAEKLALSYPMAQSSKLFVFESRVFDSVEMTRYLPKELAKTGRIDSSSKKALNQLIGELFVEQTEVNLFSSILDTPDFLWESDEHLPAYQYTRAYLEVDNRVELLNSRLAVIRDLLDVLAAQVADSNSTRLEWIIIWLISVEIVMGIASNPLFAGKRVLASLLVPMSIFAYKRINWSAIFGPLD